MYSLGDVIIIKKLTIDDETYENLEAIIEFVINETSHDPTYYVSLTDESITLRNQIIESNNIISKLELMLGEMLYDKK
jgi:hypothetical protein